MILKKLIIYEFDALFSILNEINENKIILIGSSAQALFDIVKI